MTLPWLSRFRSSPRDSALCFNCSEAETVVAQRLPYACARYPRLPLTCPNLIACYTVALVCLWGDYGDPGNKKAGRDKPLRLCFSATIIPHTYAPCLLRLQVSIRISSLYQGYIGASRQPVVLLILSVLCWQKSVIFFCVIMGKIF